LITLSLALLLCLSPIAARAESLLSGGLAKAFEAGRPVEVTVGLELDETLGMLVGMFGIPQDAFTAAQELLGSTSIIVSVRQDSEGRPDIGMELRMKDTVILDGRAWFTEDNLSLTTSLLPGKTLVMDSAELTQGFMQSMDQFAGQLEGLQAIGGSAENYLGIVVNWLTSAEGILAENDQGFPATERRNASVGSLTVRVTADQLKELVVALVEELSKDEALISLFGGAVPLAEIQALVPTANVMEWTIYVDDQGEVSGIDGVMPTLFEGAEMDARYAFDHLTGEGIERNRFRGEVSENDGAQVTFLLDITSDSTDPQAPNGGFGFNLQQTDAGSSVDFGFNHTYAKTLAPDRETLQSKSELIVKSQSDGDEPGASAGSADLISAMLASSDMSFVVDFSSETRAVGADDVVCESALGLSVMEMKLVSVLVKLASGTYAPADTSGNTVIDIANLDEAGLAALTGELSAGLERAGMLALSMVPQELLQMLN